MLRLGTYTDIEDSILEVHAVYRDNGLAFHTLVIEKFELSIKKIELGQLSKSLYFIKSCSVGELL